MDIVEWIQNAPPPAEIEKAFNYHMQQSQWHQEQAAFFGTIMKLSLAPRNLTPVAEGPVGQVTPPPDPPAEKPRGRPRKCLGDPDTFDPESDNCTNCARLTECAPIVAQKMIEAPESDVS